MNRARNRPWPAPISVVSRMTESGGVHAVGATRSSRRRASARPAPAWAGGLRPAAGCRRARVRPAWMRNARRAARQVVIGRLGAPLGHQRIAAVLADRARGVGLRVVDVAEDARRGRAGHDAGRLAIGLGHRRVVDAVDAQGALLHHLAAARRTRARRRGRPRRSTCTRCTCRSRPARCRPPRACRTRRWGTPARRAGPRSAGRTSGNAPSRCAGTAPTSKVCTRLKKVPFGSAP